MDVYWGETATFDFTTHNPATGNVQNADALPICQIFEDNVDIPVLTPLVTQRVAQVGDYRVRFTVDAITGFIADHNYNVVVQATVNGVTAKSRIAVFIARTAVPVQTRTNFKV